MNLTPKGLNRDDPQAGLGIASQSGQAGLELYLDRHDWPAGWKLLPRLAGGLFGVEDALGEGGGAVAEGLGFGGDLGEALFEVGVG